MADDPHVDRTVRSVLVLALAITLGIPLVAYLWETVNQLLNGQVDGGRLALSLPAGLVLAGLLYVAGRAFWRMAAPPPGEAGEAGRAAGDEAGGARPGGEAGAGAEPNVAGALLLSSFVLMFIFGVWLMMYVLLLGR